jgi:hypothetical protein
MQFADDGAQVRSVDGLAALPQNVQAHHHGFVFLSLNSV